MSTDPKTVAFIVDQAAGAGAVSAKPMFGEYGVYCDGRMVAMVCDDRLFVKPTAAGRALAEGASDAPPYPGAKPCLLIDPDRWDDRDWLSELFRVSAAQLPLPLGKRAPRAR
jgi:TfoX/Sxy family transcriptional regulator of competence genes